MVLVQTGRTFRQRKPNAAEEEIASFLNRLPEEKYKAFREFSIDAQISESMKGFRKKRPDFIVVGPDIGIVVIEVKNWNILRNQYRWVDQETVEILVPGQPAESADNPERQRDAYERALIDLVGQKFGIYVDALLAFPTCSRTDFLNKLSEPQAVACPGSKYLFNLSKMLFREDIESYRSSPEELLHKVVRADSRSRGCTPGQVAMAWSELLPHELRVGGMDETPQRYSEFRCLSEEQIAWVLNQDETKNVLLDIAGSGKTNALVSKAVHLLGTAPTGRVPRILLTTYSDNLATNIQRQFEQKLGAERQLAARAAVRIASMPTLIASLVENLHGPEYARDPTMSAEDYETFCKELVTEDIEKGTSIPSMDFDWVLIDEVQDFDNTYLAMLRHFAGQGKFFAVGDVAQRIHDRHCDLKYLGILRDAALPKSYRMYRTPRYIAELARHILTTDRGIMQELDDAKYDLNQIESKNPFPYVATLWPANETITDLTGRICDLQDSGVMRSDIMVIAPSRQIPGMTAALQRANIPVQDREITRGEFITVVDFEHAKGLERKEVLISGVEDLPVRTSLSLVGKSEVECARLESFSRRKLFVALTRTLENATVFYEDPSAPLVSELIQANATITKRRGARAGR
jgi:superfamily I DNA/RNA helicase